MADETLSGQTAGTENLESDAGSAQNPDESQAGVSPASGTDTAAELAALRAQVERERDRNKFLEQSLQIQERFLESRNGASATSKPTPQDVGLDKELETLDKALDPLFQKRLKAVTEPLNQSFQAIVEDNDAMRFESFLTRNHPELLDDEDSYNATVQQVQQVRDAARQRGINISRVDAFVFNQGLQGTKAKVAARKAKKTTAATQETRRQAETRAATATSASSEPRASANAGIQAIRQKAARGERLTESERAQYKSWVSDVEI